MSFTHGRKREIGAMLDDIARECAMTASRTGRLVISGAVLEAMRTVPRHEFIAEAYRGQAYEDRALAIGLGQTISQPFVVALMTDLLEPRRDQVILEIGTGSGYQAAILATLVKQVYTIEIVPQLAQRARDTLARLGHDNVQVVEGDGGAGLAEHAPYDGIIVTAAAPEVPAALLEQLRPGGRLVIPVNRDGYSQALMLIEKDRHGIIQQHSVLAVVFVPLTGERWRQGGGQ